MGLGILLFGKEEGRRGSSTEQQVGLQVSESYIAYLWTGKGSGKVESCNIYAHHIFVTHQEFQLPIQPFPLFETLPCSNPLGQCVSYAFSYTPLPHLTPYVFAQVTL